ncbi:hypothetical protein Dsin_029627 [Dipteronia sinensis]|uniref:Reverse transcriptase domain-containing protein n=1 Tax=Dipteronia sinensis TaxID=43782 RepID=A0AAD9ZU86_9ROSI|nr:hypothetical protein Dsin_029627 [Dipteronia sinensis]
MLSFGLLLFLINEEPRGRVVPSRGLCQGCPLSPYLFLICAEGITALINMAESEGKIHGLNVERGAPSITHLLFVDDCLMFVKASRSECEFLKGILVKYEAASGQKINFEKSALTFSPNTSSEVVDDIRGIFILMLCHAMRRAGQMVTTVVSSPPAGPQIDSHDPVLTGTSTQAPQNNSPTYQLELPDPSERQTDTTVFSSAPAGPQIDSHVNTVVSIAESIDGHSTQAFQNQNHAPTSYQLNLPDRSLLPSISRNRDLYCSKCVPLQKAALTGNIKEARNLLGVDPRRILLTAITERDETVLHIAAGARQTAFVEEILKLMEPDDMKLQDRNGNSAFCFAAAARSMGIAKLMLDKNPDLITLRGAENMVPLYIAALYGRAQMAEFLYDGTESHLTEYDQAHLFFKCIRTDLYDELFRNCFEIVGASTEASCDTRRARGHSLAYVGPKAFFIVCL